MNEDDYQFLEKFTYTVPNIESGFINVFNDLGKFPGSNMVLR